MSYAHTMALGPDQGRRGGASRRPEIGILILGLLASLGLYWLTDGWETERRAALVREQVQVYGHALEETLEHLVGDVQVLTQFYDATDDVSAEAFARFARPFLQRHPGLRALEWVPRVRASERAAFEAGAQAEGLAGFAVWERVAGTARPAGPRAEYFPLYRVEPRAGNAAALGFDQAADPVRLAAMERALDTGQPTASAPQTLARETESQRSLTIFVPQAPGSPPGATAQARRDALRGFAAGVLRLGDLVDGTLARLPPHALDLALRDPSLPGDAGWLHVHPSRVREAAGPPDPAALFDDPRGHEVRLEVAGRTLTLRGVPAPGTDAASLLPLTLLGLGLAVSAALAALVRYRRAAAARLRDGEERLRLALDAARMGIFDWEIPTNRIVWSRQHEILFCFAPGEFGGTYESFASRVHPEDRPRLDAEVARCIAAREPIRCEYRAIWPDGSLHWIEARGEFVLDNDGRPLRVRGTVVEITDLKQAELELRIFQRIVETSSEMLLFVDPDRRFRVVNPAYAALYQVAPEALQGHSVRAVVGEAVYARIGPELDAALAGEHRRFGFETLCPDGQRRYLEADQRPFRGDDGAVIGAVTSLHDVTQSRLVQAALLDQQAALAKLVAARTAQLQDSESKLRTIYDLLPIGISMTDRSGRIVECNRASETLLGLSRDQQLQRTDDGREWAIVRPDGTPMPSEEYASVRAMAEQRTVRDVEMGVVRSDGIAWISVSAMPYPHPDYGVLVAYVDITARRQAEDALRLFKTVAETSDEAIAISDPQGALVYVNPAHARLFGRPTEQAIGLNCRHYYPPESVEVLDREAAPALARGESWEGELDALDSAGRRFPLWERLGAVRAEDGKLLYAFGFMHDVTARKRIESRLKASEAKARAVIDASPVPLALAHETGAVRYINAAFAETFGYALAEIPTWEHWRLKAYPDPAYREWVQKTREECPDGALEVSVRCKDGTTRTVMARATPLGSASEERLTTLYDITDLKRAREQAERAALTQSEFLAHMSHEIRSPMNGILGLSELALRRPLDPVARDYLEQLHGCGLSLLGILDDILDHSKIEAGRLSLDCAPFGLDALLASLQSLFSHAAEAQGIALAIEAAPDVPRYLLGDALRLRQVLSNLLSNAIKFTAQGRVDLKVACRGREGSWATLHWSVEDTGIGMDETTRARLFEPFVQGDSSIARRYGGSGLGLSISRDLARLMGGELTAQSAPGVGSRFALELRLAVAAGAPVGAQTDPTACATLAGTRILVAEDQPVNQRVIGDMLRLLGARVALASHGGEALERLAEGPFDAVLMDIQMPGMDGLTATRRIREDPTRADLPVIALTAGVTEAERARIGACGMTDLLAKPVTLEALGTTLGRWIGSPDPETQSARATASGVPPSSPERRTPDAEASGAPLALPGFDLPRLLRAVGGATKASDLLRQLAEAIRDDARAIGQALARGETAEAGAQLHRLRGACAALCATDLYAAATRLEADLEAGRDPAPALDALCQAHALTLAAIASLPPPPAATRAAPDRADPQAARRLIAEIRAQLAQGLRIPRGLLADLGEALPERDRALYLDLKRHLVQFDYRAAGLLLERLPSAPSEPETRSCRMTAPSF